MNSYGLRAISRVWSRRQVELGYMEMSVAIAYLLNQCYCCVFRSLA
jgi:hypothetical protein